MTQTIKQREESERRARIAFHNSPEGRAIEAQWRDLQARQMLEYATLRVKECEALLHQAEATGFLIITRRTELAQAQRWLLDLQTRPAD